MPLKTLLALLTASSFALSCGQDSGVSMDEFTKDMAPEAPFEERAIPASAGALASPQADSGRVQQSAAPVPTRRKVIRHGNLSLEVSGIEESIGDIKTLVERRGGYISNETMSEDYYSAKSGSISCRIPAGDLDAVMEEIKAMGRLEELSINADDITEQYFDLEIRIRNQKQLETRLLDLLRRQTNKLSDLLEIERELARVRTDIDGMEGKKRFWDNQVAFSTLMVEIHEPRPAIASEEGGALRTLLRSFSRAGNNFVLAIAGIIAFSGAALPLVLFLGLGLWLIVKMFRRRRKRSSELKAE